jgi:hypothetical protein
MRGAIQTEKGMRGFWGQNTLQHFGNLQLHFHLRWTNECKDSDDSRAQSMTSTSTDDVRLLSMNFDFPSRLVLSQLFQRQEHSWFSLAENLQAAMNF